MLLSTHINVLDKFGDSPNYRNSASDLFQELPADSMEVVLDFSGVSFISRGFADQLVKERLRLQEERDLAIHFEHVNTDVAAMLDIVSRTQSHTSRERVSIPVIRVNNLDELDQLLFSY